MHKNERCVHIHSENTFNEQSISCLIYMKKYKYANYFFIKQVTEIKYFHGMC